ncbi:MAG: hypothetical protein WDN75_19785, partial [Bacteroidota bacterium]
MLLENNPYTTLWNKYRPMILKLMVDSGKDSQPQQYKLFPHEFKAVGIKEKTGYSFVLEVSQGKAINKIKGSTVARDLLSVLQQSQKASQLMNEAIYEFKMDKQFIFHVSKKVEVVLEPAAVAEG